MKCTKILLCIITITFLGCSGFTKQKHFQDYPRTDKSSTEDSYYGTIIKDEYRYLEHLKDTAVAQWFKDQDVYAEKYLNNFPGQEQIANQIKGYHSEGQPSVSNIKYSDNGHAFFLKSEGNNLVQKLFYRESNSLADIELFDPSGFQKDLNREYTISYVQPSWEGQYVLLSLSYNGIKGSELITIDVKNRKPLPEIITHAEPEYYLGVSWLPDSSGFLYLYIPVLDPDNEAYMLNSSTVLYKLGEDPEKRHVVFSAESDQYITQEDIPIAKVLSKNDKYIIGYKASSENYWSAYYTTMEDLATETMHWKPFYGTDEKIFADYGFFMEAAFVFVSGKNADNRTISSFDLKTEPPYQSKVLVPEKKDEVINILNVANNALYFTTSRFGVEANLYEYKNDQETKLKLPYQAGAIDLYSSSKDSPNLYVNIDGWTTNYTRYIFSGGTFSLDPLSNNRSYPEFDDLVVKEIQVASHDGVQVPLSIIHQSDMEFNGQSPTLIYAYGAYGESLTPYFSTIFLNWVKNGGVLAVPHIRGGGEKGDSWHEQGMKTTKPNSWKDLITCTEYLISNKYTSPEKTVLYSSSAGTVATGMAMVERPELYKVFIAEAPMLNPLRNEARSNNASNYLEYGTIKDSLECMGLIKMDPYVNLKPNTEYPAALIIAGYNDSRIDPWIPGKFAAKLQECSTSGLPVFLDVNYNVGHEGGDTFEETIATYSRMFAFAFWQTDHKIKD
ncbi:prolyl oligopeptidase family serine peptidase [Snuella lapsa]|uniref:prolyl oligopeptidase family serine peptidase n=1 Tax=Snuella lapsa TaxID=870481 RepID=UPI0031EE1023